MATFIIGASGRNRTGITWVEARSNYQTTTDANLAGQRGKVNNLP